MTAFTSSRLRKKSVRVEIGIFGDTKPSPAILLALLGQLCAICFSRYSCPNDFFRNLLGQQCYLYGIKIAEFRGTFV
jgi:hypothetical protein